MTCVVRDWHGSCWWNWKRRIYLTTGFRQPGAVGLYLTKGYTALFDSSVDPEVYKSLPFEKDISHLALSYVAEASGSQQRLAAAGR